LNPCELEACSPAVEKAIAPHMPIKNVNSATRASPTAIVGSDDAESAKIAMGYLTQKLKGKDNIVIIHGIMGQTAQVQRDEGARSILAHYPEIKVLAQQTANWDRAQRIDLMQNWIQTYGEKIDAVFAHNDEMGLGAGKALQEVGRKEKVLVISIDGIQDALVAVKNGDLDATVFQNAKDQGAGAIHTAVKIKKTLLVIRFLFHFSWLLIKM
jgi:inositol transport system substrate-binding protein